MAPVLGRRLVRAAAKGRYCPAVRRFGGAVCRPPPARCECGTAEGRLHSASGEMGPTDTVSQLVKSECVVMHAKEQTFSEATRGASHQRP
jgi:hypothetical protein